MIFIDFETRSEVDIKKVGAYKYASHPTTEVLCIGIASTLGGVYILKPGEFKFNTKNLIVVAHNAFFERMIWKYKLQDSLGLVPDVSHWRCTASMAAAHALPRSLEKACEVLDLPMKKDSKASRVMLQLAKPRNGATKWWDEKDYPEKYQTLYEYCKQDVRATRDLYNRLPELNDTELKVWQLDQKINERGVQIDVDSADKILTKVEDYKCYLDDEMPTLTNMDVTSVKQRDKCLTWLRNNQVNLDSFSIKEIEKLDTSDFSPDVKRVLDIRKRVGKTSTAKYGSILNACNDDGRIRDTLMYHGASTGRWSGKLVQFQNLPRGNVSDYETHIENLCEAPIDLLEIMYENPMDIASSCIRGMIVAKKQHELLVADYSNIETRVLMWFCEDEEALQVFRDGGDIYKEMASYIYKKPTELINAAERQLGKQAILGCGYGMGSDKFKITCSNYGITIDDDMSKRVIKSYRDKYVKVKQLWYGIERSAIACVRSGRPTNWLIENDFLYYILPSGRRLAYYKPKLETVITPWGDEKEQLTFIGVNSITRQSERQSTYGGKLVENIIQAIARDIMANAMLTCEEAGYKLVLSVHDELISEVPEQSKTIEEFCELMCQLPDWAKDCPIDAEGWTGKRYKK